MNQTLALLIDAYRDLQARKLFWISIILSLLVAVMFAFIGINERGVTFFGKEYPGLWNTSIIPRDTFYKYLFSALAIPYWLGFLAAILALISVAGLFPDMISSGSIDLYLCRPIGRWRLYLTKYMFGLLFAALQVLLFSTAAFFVMGTRGGVWEPRIFLAVPLVTLFFSYLFCFCVLIGIITRSTLAAILLTLLFWAGLWAVHTADMGVTVFTTAAEDRVEKQKAVIAANERLISMGTGNMSQFEFQRDRQKELLVEYEQRANDLRWWQRLLLGIKTPLPKTTETVDLLTRWTVDPDPFLAAEEESDRRRGPSTQPPSERIELNPGSSDVRRRLVDELGARKVAWIVGTSVGFEVVVLGLAGWIFARRDY